MKLGFDLSACRRLASSFRVDFKSRLNEWFDVVDFVLMVSVWAHESPTSVVLLEEQRVGVPQAICFTKGWEKFSLIVSRFHRMLSDVLFVFVSSVSHPCIEVLYYELVLSLAGAKGVVEVAFLL